MSVLDLIVERTRLRAARATRFMEALWAADMTSPDQGLSITPGEVRRRLLSAAEMAAMRADFHATDEVARSLAPAIDVADAALAADSGWSRLIQGFALSPPEADLLATAIALERHPDLGRVFAYLADEVAATLPSIAVVGQLYDAALGDTTAMRRWRLAEADPAPIAALAGWRAAPVVARSLALRRWDDPMLAEGAAVLTSVDAATLLDLHPDALARATRRLEAGASVDLVGPRGSGRQTLAARLAAAREQGLLRVDTARLLASGGAPVDLLVAALRMARVERAIACFDRGALVTAEQWRTVLRADTPVVRCYTPDDAAQPDVDAITLAPLALAERMALWRHLSPDAPPPAVSAARVTAGEITRLARGGEAGGSDEPVPDLLTRLPTPYGWDDLILPPETKAILKDFAAQVRLRGTVLEGWGFDRLTHLGSGLVALFAGPSGVGKTMATQVLARELGLELFRVDLAGVVDKYIGETEKRLRAAFAFAERPDVLMMFDEADALFGTRTSAKDSHDRYANLEINYLLQRIETFDGIAVLATNRKSELDAAFRRRLRTMVDFLQPGPAERLALWRIALPPLAPDGSEITEGIDVELLAERLALTGADIKSVALGAAFLACGEGAKIGMRHVLAAAQREMAKHGQTMRVPLMAAQA